MVPSWFTKCYLKVGYTTIDTILQAKSLRHPASRTQTHLVINLLYIVIFILAVYYRHNVCFVCMFLVFFYLADNEYKEHQLLEEVKRINNHKVCGILPHVR